MITATIKKILNSDIQSVWETVLCVKQYSRWRSDLSKTQVIHDGPIYRVYKGRICHPFHRHKNRTIPSLGV